MRLSVIVPAFFLMSSAFIQAQTTPNAAIACSTGSAIFFGQSEAQNTTIGTPFAIQLNASANGCNITYVRLYADDKALREYTVNSPSGGFNFPQVALPNGYHKMVGVAWDAAGYSFRTPDLNLFVANEDATVYISSPQEAASLSSGDVHFDVRTRWDYTMPNGYPGNKVTHLRVYVDNQAIYDANNNLVNFYKTFAPGVHTVVAVAWDAKGEHIQSSNSFTVK